MSGAYDDMLQMSHPVSEKRAAMRHIDRAIQFVPFAALTGYDAVVREAERLTMPHPELDSEVYVQLNRRFQALHARKDQHLILKVTYFCPDAHKAGGAYVTATGEFQRLNLYTRMILMTDGRQIPMDEVLRLQF